MALFTILMPLILKKEGGYVNDPDDSGGATNRGVTLAVWKKLGYDKNKDGLIDERDIMLLTDADAALIAKRQYWDYFLADTIKSQEVANMIVDWGWISGQVTVALKIQHMLGLKADGVFGPITVGAINKRNPSQIFDQIKAARLAHVEAIIKASPVKIKYRNGWINRINGFDSPSLAQTKTLAKGVLGMGIAAMLIWAGFKFQ